MIYYVQKLCRNKTSDLERRSLDREVLRLNPTDAASKLGQVRLLLIAYVSPDASSISEIDGSRGLFYSITLGTKAGI